MCQGCRRHREEPRVIPHSTSLPPLSAPKAGAPILCPSLSLGKGWGIFRGSERPFSSRSEPHTSRPRRCLCPCFCRCLWVRPFSLYSTTHPTSAILAGPLAALPRGVRRRTRLPPLPTKPTRQNPCPPRCQPQKHPKPNKIKIKVAVQKDNLTLLK